jgi:hypothetical protein
VFPSVEARRVPHSTSLLIPFLICHSLRVAVADVAFDLFYAIVRAFDT